MAVPMNGVSSISKTGTGMGRSGYTRFRSLALGSIAVLLLMTVVVASVRATTAEAPVIADWPAMTLVYETVGYNADPPEVHRYRLEYQDLLHWRKEEIHDSSHPNPLRSLQIADGQDFTLDTLGGVGDTPMTIVDDTPTATERWLFPGRDRWLVDEYGYAPPVEIDPKHLRFTRIETLPCQTSVPSLAGHCSVAPTRTLKTELIYRTDLGVPLPISRTTYDEHGNVTGSWKVIELAVGGNAEKSSEPTNG